MLMTLAAVDALEGVLNDLVALPEVARNDNVLERFRKNEAHPKIGERLILCDEDIRNDASMMGGSQYELSVPAELTYLVEGEPGDDRDAVFAAGFEAIAGALYPGGLPLSVDGSFDSLSIGGDTIERLRYAASDGKPPVIGIRFLVVLLITAPTPLG